jgi:hypothetical protein
LGSVWRRAGVRKNFPTIGDITMNDKLNITIRIANQAPIPLSINRDDEEVIRTAEFNVNKLWNAWSAKFKNKSSMEVLAMVAFRFAELFFTQNALAKNAEEALAAFEETLDKILVGLPDADEPGA